MVLDERTEVVRRRRCMSAVYLPRLARAEEGRQVQTLLRGNGKPRQRWGERRRASRAAASLHAVEAALRGTQARPEPSDGPERRRGAPSSGGAGGLRSTRWSSSGKATCSAALAGVAAAVEEVEAAAEEAAGEEGEKAVGKRKRFRWSTWWLKVETPRLWGGPVSSWGHGKPPSCSGSARGCAGAAHKSREADGQCPQTGLRPFKPGGAPAKAAGGGGGRFSDSRTWWLKARNPQPWEQAGAGCGGRGEPPSCPGGAPGCVGAVGRLGSPQAGGVGAVSSDDARAHARWHRSQQ